MLFILIMTALCEILCSFYTRLTSGKRSSVGLFRFLRRLCANLLVYVIHIFPILPRCYADGGKQTVIVSMTSFPARVKQLWKVAEMMLRQRADCRIKVILWLSKEQFPHMEKSLPWSLLGLRKRGLEIVFVDGDLKPHKKYYYAFELYPSSVVVTVDDDVLYPLDLVQRLLDTHRQYPDCVCCNRGRLIPSDKKHRMCWGGDSYSNWKILSATEHAEKNIALLPTGVGGVLYPPGSYDKRIFNPDAIKATCLCGDDLWINFMCRLTGKTSIVHSPNNLLYVNLFFSQKGSLYKSNVNRSNNDNFIRLISEWAEANLGCDYFVNIPVAKNKD